MSKKPKKISPFSEQEAFLETAAKVNPDISPVSGRNLIEVLVGPASGPKIRALARPEERICMPKMMSSSYVTK